MIMDKIRALFSPRAENVTLAQLVDLLSLGGVSRDKMSEATYFACIKILSESVGKLPLKVQQTTDADGIKELSGHYLYKTLRLEPNPYQTATEFWSGVEASKQHDGNAIVVIDGTYKNTRLWQAQWKDVSMWIDNKRLWSSENKVWYLIATDDGTIVKYPADRIMHFKTFWRDGLVGIPVRDALGDLIGGSQNAQGMVNKLYKTGFTARAVLNYTGDLNDELEKKLVSHVQDYAEGKIDTSRSIVPLPVGMTLTPLSLKLTDAQYIEVRKHSALQIAAAFGIKPQQINDYEKSSYASAEAQSLSFYVETLLYILKSDEEEIARKLFTAEDIAAGIRPKFNVNAILRADIKTQMESLVSAVQNSIYTPNEARSMLDFGNRPGGDQLIANGNVIPLTQVGNQYKKTGGE